MEPDFWHQRWQQDLIGFHQADVNPYLEKNASLLGLKAGDTVFVPLCGKSLDMWWLHGQGYKVLGVELSPKACEAFYTEAGVHPQQSKTGPFTSWKASGVEILCGDFFDLTSEMLKDVRGVYDRAALIALPPALREIYVQHLARVVPENVTGLLIAMEYPQGEMQGPPFSVMQEEIESLFAVNFKVELLEDIDAMAGNPRFRDRGLSSMHEKVYRFQRR